MPWHTLVSPASLAAALGDPRLVILDCRFNLAEPAAGRAAWQAGHIPGARFADLEQDLSGPVSPRAGGRHPLPDPAALAARLGGWGIGDDTQAVVYDAVSGMLASRAWWLLRWLGHERVAVLDGGWPAWLEAGGEAVTEPPDVVPRTFTARPGSQPVVDATGVAAGLADGSLLLLDARAAARFAGRHEPLDKIAGRVPGAVNLPQTGHLDSHGRLRPPAELAAQFQALLQDRPATSVACMCGSGVSACHTLLAMAHAGLPGAALYAGSWSDWISDPARPVATG